MNPPEVHFYRNPNLKEIELRFSLYRQHAFEKHVHDTYSIGLIRHGQTRFLHEKSAFRIGEGDIALINPGEVHACNPQPDSQLMYYMLYIEAPFLQSLAAQMNGRPQNPLVFTRPVVQDRLLYEELERLFTAMLDGKSLLEVEGRLYDVLSRIVLAYTRSPAQPEYDNRPEALEKGSTYLRENLAENISLYNLAEHCGLSPYHFLRIFSEHFGLPPHSYQMQLRIQEARRRLAAGESGAQVAAALGFADQSHLIRKFKEGVGATPGQYQNNTYSSG